MAHYIPNFFYSGSSSFDGTKDYDGDIVWTGGSCMASKDRLIGADASVYTATWGTTLTTGTLLSGTWYKVLTISGTTPFSSFYGVGDLVMGNGVLTAVAPYTFAPATFTVVQDASSFDISFSADEVEVTTLNDEVKKYRPGKTDMSGTIRGINFISEMKKAGSFLNRFLRTVSVAAVSLSSTTSAQQRGELYGQFWVQDDSTTSGEVSSFLFGQVELYGYNLGAAVGDAQSYESSFRFIGADPIMYFKANS